jgi:ATP-dependent DNA ligase
VFDLVRGHGTNARAILCVFDLLEVNGEDIRREPIEDRKRRLAGLLRLPHDGIALNEHFGGDGAMIYKHACALGCEGIISKRLGSPYRAGRSSCKRDPLRRVERTRTTRERDRGWEAENRCECDKL